MGKKFTHEYVEQVFIENGCILLEKYQDIKTPMEYICVCSRTSKISFDNFKRGRRCKNCSIDKVKKSLKHSYSKVYQDFVDGGCILLSNTYVNGHTPLEYKCECGNISKIRYFDFLKGKRCWECKSRKTAERDRLDYNYVRKQFEVAGCTLLSKEYINAHQKLIYKCSCGTIAEIKYDKFKMGQRCQNCKLIKMAGENHYNYNLDISDEERQIKRNYPEYREWAKNVKERDNYTCQKCNQRGYKLISHHIESYRYNEDKRIDLDNGITLCDACHRVFHSKYSYINVNRKQFEEFMENNQSNVI